MRIIIDWLVLPIRSLVPAVILLVSLFSACSQSTSLTARPLTVAASVAFTDRSALFVNQVIAPMVYYLIANGGCLRAKGEMVVRHCLELPEPI